MHWERKRFSVIYPIFFLKVIQTLKKNDNNFIISSLFEPKYFSGIKASANAIFIPGDELQ